MELEIIGGDNTVQEDGTPMENGWPEWERREDGMIQFSMMYSLPETLEGLKLVPIYTQKGVHLQKAIPMVKPVNQ